MNAQEMWEQYSRKDNICAEYSAWAFGEAADVLADLVLKGIKTATSSACPLYALAGEALPEAGEYSVILSGSGAAVCIVRTEKVYVAPFIAIREEHAWKEGEKDRSLRCWREDHARFFTRCMQEAGLEFSEEMPVVCEEFVRVFP